jgi:hypothetical protein
MIPAIWDGEPEDVLWVEAVADRVERALIERRER